MGLWNWSTTAANNATADPSINWQEGQAPSTVNDSARAMMAAIAVQFQTGWEWQMWGDTPTYVSATQFTVPGNLTSRYTVGRRVRASVTAGTVYGTITNSAFTSLTTVTVALDSGSLDSGLSEVDVGILNPGTPSFPSALNHSLLNVQVFASNGTYTPTPGATKAIVKAVGGGGAGGGAASTNSGQWALGAGGSSGAYGEIYIGSGLASQTVTVGTGGTGVSAGTGGNGGQTSFGALLVCPGGPGGSPGGAGSAGGTATFAGQTPGAGAVSGSGTRIFSTTGGNGAAAFSLPGNFVGGDGGSNNLGQGGGAVAGSAASGYGAGGPGAANLISQSAKAGLNGTGGVVLVYEFI